jgi:hypothetical protein
MRLYAFGNVYLSQIQQGIQGLHAVVELFSLAQELTEQVGSENLPAEYKAQFNMLYLWAKHYKTVIFLNGGNQADLTELDLFLSQGHYPVSRFCEDEISINGALTSVCIILPEKIYEGAKFWQSRFNRSQFTLSLREPSTWVSVDGSVKLVLNADDTVTIFTFEGEIGETKFYSAWERELMEKLVTYRLA